MNAPFVLDDAIYDGNDDCRALVPLRNDQTRRIVLYSRFNEEIDV